MGQANQGNEQLTLALDEESEALKTGTADYHRENAKITEKNNEQMQEVMGYLLKKRLKCLFLNL